MDTRSKILDWDTAVACLRARDYGVVVTGYFDPLLAGHARRLAELAGVERLLVIVAEPERPLLEARARAELVAALRVAEAVTLAPPQGLAELLASLPETTIVREEEADARRAREFVDHIRSRHES